MFSVTQTTIAARSVRLNTTTKRDVTRRYARTHTALLFLVGVCFSPLSLFLSLSLKHLANIPRHVKWENVNLQKKKNAARALLLLESSLIRERERRKEMRGRKNNLRARVFSARRSFSREEKKLCWNARAQFLVLFFL